MSHRKGSTPGTDLVVLLLASWSEFLDEPAMKLLLLPVLGPPYLLRVPGLGPVRSHSRHSGPSSSPNVQGTRRTPNETPTSRCPRVSFGLHGQVCRGPNPPGPGDAVGGQGQGLRSPLQEVVPTPGVEGAVATPDPPGWATSDPDPRPRPLRTLRGGRRPTPTPSADTEPRWHPSGTMGRVHMPVLAAKTSFMDVDSKVRDHPDRCLLEDVHRATDVT